MPKPWAGLLWAQSWWLETREGSMREKRGLSTSCSRHSKHGPAGHHAPSPRRHSNGQATVVSREPPMLALWSQPRVLGGSRTLTSLSHQYASSPSFGCTEHLSQVQHRLLRETKPLLKPLELQPRQRMKSSPHKPHIRLGMRRVQAEEMKRSPRPMGTQALDGSRGLPPKLRHQLRGPWALGPAEPRGSQPFNPAPTVKDLASKVTGK